MSPVPVNPLRFIFFEHTQWEILIDQLALNRLLYMRNLPILGRRHSTSCIVLRVSHGIRLNIRPHRHKMVNFQNNNLKKNAGVAKVVQKKVRNFYFFFITIAND